MKVNGGDHPLVGQPSLMEYLRSCGYDPMKVAVERNGDIVPKREFETLILKEDDCLEIVRFVGGG